MQASSIPPSETKSRRAEFWAGVRATIPLLVGAAPFGLIYGALAVASRLSPLAAAAMSAFVFAGSAQFIAVGLVGAGAAVPIIILTTFVVNLRHMLYSATLAPHMGQLPRKVLLPLGFWLTDESFAVAAKRYNQPGGEERHWFLLGSELAMYLNWQLVTWIGILAGRAISDPAAWGLDFAMVVTFIGIMVPEVKTRPSLLAVLVAGGTALLAQDLPHQAGLLLAALLGILAGVLAERSLGDE